LTISVTEDMDTPSGYWNAAQRPFQFLSLNSTSEQGDVLLTKAQGPRPSGSLLPLGSQGCLPYLRIFVKVFKLRPYPCILDVSTNFLFVKLIDKPDIILGNLEGSLSVVQLSNRLLEHLT